MKKVFIAVAMLMGIAVTVSAQTQAKQAMSKMAMGKMEMKDGVMMSNNKMMLCHDMSCTPLTKTYVCKDGSKISVDGTIIKANGSKSKLKNGYEVDRMGMVMMIPHGEAGHVCTKDCPKYMKM